MKGIKFGEYHTWDDFNLVVQERDISAPKPKMHFVDIEGADGSLDFSEAFGDVKYSRRTLKYTVASLAPRSEFWLKFSEVQNTLHGREFRIYDDEDQFHYYVGRVSIDKWKIDRSVGSFVITVDAEPYKYHLYETNMTYEVTGSRTMVFPNDRMPVSPTISVTSPMTVTFGGKTISIGTPGVEFLSLDIVFRQGVNTMEAVGDGMITVKYQEGSL